MRSDLGTRSAEGVVEALGGIARRDELITAGVSGSDITRAVRLGVLRRVRRAHYAIVAADAAAVAATRVGGRLGGPSAARTYGVWAGFDDRTHVVVPPNASRLRLIREDGRTTPDRGEHPVALHWETTEPGRECWRVSLLDALRQTVSWCDEETGLAALDTVLDLGLVAPDRLRDAFAREPEASRRVAAAARVGSGSGYESIAARRFERLGLRVRQQVAVPGVGRVDGCLEDVLFYEVDGDGFHSSPAARETDRRRDAAALAGGGAVIRFGARRIREDWAGCVTDAVAAIRRRVPARRFQEIRRRMARNSAKPTLRGPIFLKTESDTPS